MKKFTILFAFLIISLNIWAQPPAPDFTITDTNGNEHQLYADHLDQGQTVLIKVFFTVCPPCISAAPHIEELYQDWGAGQYDVEFFELSNKGFDSNADVLSYQIAHGQTYPAAGNDGGSIAALTEYTNGTFGQFFGTPTYIVISPNGDVNYDVSGFGIEATIDSLNAAISATGATGGPATPDFTSYDVNIKDVYGQSISPSETKMYLRSSSDASVNYDILNLVGSYSFDYPSDLLPEVENPILQFENQQEVGESLSALDLLKYQKHILNIEPINSSLIVQSGDVNHSGSLSALDLSLINKVILNIDNSFPNRDAWEFFIENCANCQTYALPISLGSTIDISVTGVRMGDANY